MNKKRLSLFVWLFILSLSANSQQGIELLLPIFEQQDGIDVIESLDNGASTRQGNSSYSFRIERESIDLLPVGLIDTLTATFERELPLATESDRYQKHSENGDTLSYTLAYNGTINPVGNVGRLNVMNHHYSNNTRIATALDIENGTFRFHYYRSDRAKNMTDESDDTADGARSLADLFAEIANNPHTKVTDVIYDINNGNSNGNWSYCNSVYGFVHRKGWRLEINRNEADSVFHKMRSAIEKISRTAQVFSFNSSRDEVNIAFGKNWSGDVYCLRRLSDGRVFVLHVEKPDKPCDLAIPYNWHEVDRISRMK